MTHVLPSRRTFLHASLGGLAAGAAGMVADAAPAETSKPDSNKKLFTSVKWGMVDVPGSVLDKFRLQKELGFDGVELDSPTEIDRDEVVAAMRQTGMPVHGVVDSVHWNQRLSSPDPAVRALGARALRTAIDDTRHYGGSAVLLVPGRVGGEDETHEHVWQRSITEIRKVLPQAARQGVRILIENVWNGFCEKPELLRDYIDEIDSPWVGVYFDIGNVRKFSPSEAWIRVLGRRVVKLDIKDWSRPRGFCKIGDGDVNWPEVRKALEEIGFTGWCTAEVAGGDRARLAEIAERMNRALNL